MRAEKWSAAFRRIERVLFVWVGLWTLLMTLGVLLDPLYSFSGMPDVFKWLLSWIDPGVIISGRVSVNAIHLWSQLTPHLWFSFLFLTFMILKSAEKRRLFTSCCLCLSLMCVGFYTWLVTRSVNAADALSVFAPAFKVEAAHGQLFVVSYLLLFLAWCGALHDFKFELPQENMLRQAHVFFRMNTWVLIPLLSIAAFFSDVVFFDSTLWWLLLPASLFLLLGHFDATLKKMVQVPLDVDGSLSHHVFYFSLVGSSMALYAVVMGFVGHAVYAQTGFVVAFLIVLSMPILLWMNQRARGFWDGVFEIRFERFEAQKMLALFCIFLLGWVYFLSHGSEAIEAISHFLLFLIPVVSVLTLNSGSYFPKTLRAVGVRIYFWGSAAALFYMTLLALYTQWSVRDSHLTSQENARMFSLGVLLFLMFQLWGLVVRFAPKRESHAR